MVGRIYYYQTFTKYAHRETEELHVINCGEVQCVPGFTLGMKCIGEYHLYIVLSGKGTLTVDDRAKQVQEGQVFLLRPGQECICRAHMAEPWKYCFVTFSGTHAGCFAQKMGFVKGISVMASRLDVRELLVQVQRLFAYYEDTQRDQLTRSEIAKELFLMLSGQRSVPQKGRKRKDDATPESYVSRVLEYIHDHYSDMQVSDIAQHIGINRSYMNRLFKKQMGTSTQDYLMNYRMNAACRMLSNTTLSIREVAQRIGYDNQLTFSKMFRRSYGVSPSGYRERMRSAAEAAMKI